MAGPGSTGHLVQNMSGLFEMLMQRRQIENAEQQQKVNQLVIFGDLLSKSTSPEQANGLQKMFENLGLDPAALSEMRTNIAPTLDTQRAGVIHAGRGKMSTERQAQVGEEAATTAFTGQTALGLDTNNWLRSVLGGDDSDPMTQAMKSRMAAGALPGAVAVDRRLSTDPSAQGIALGTVMNAAQQAGDIRTGQSLGLQAQGQEIQRWGLDIQNQLGWAGNRLGWANLFQQGGFELNRMHLAKAQMAAQAGGDQKALPILTAIDEEMRAGVEQQGQMTSAARDLRIASINAKIMELRKMGYNMDLLPGPGNPRTDPSHGFKSQKDVGVLGITRIK